MTELLREFGQHVPRPQFTSRARDLIAEYFCEREVLEDRHYVSKRFMECEYVRIGRLDEAPVESIQERVGCFVRDDIVRKAREHRAAGKVPFGTSSFVTKYVWPGTFRMVYVPELLAAIDRSPMQLAGLYNDRRNYHLWARNGQRRWVENRAQVLEQAGEEIYRLFNLLFMGTAGVMNDPAQTVTAYRMVLELPE